MNSAHCARAAGQAPSQSLSKHGIARPARRSKASSKAPLQLRPVRARRHTRRERRLDLGKLNSFRRSQRGRADGPEARKPNFKLDAPRTATVCKVDRIAK